MKGQKRPGGETVFAEPKPIKLLIQLFSKSWTPEGPRRARGASSKSPRRAGYASLIKLCEFKIGIFIERPFDAPFTGEDEQVIALEVLDVDRICSESE